MRRGMQIRLRPGDRRRFEWLCRRGGRRVQGGCAGDVGGPAGGGSGCWRAARTSAYERTGRVMRPEHLGGSGGRRRVYRRARPARGLELAQIVAQLVEAVSVGREIERLEDGRVDVAGGPAADLRAGVQKNLEETDDTGVVDFDARV